MKIVPASYEILPTLPPLLQIEAAGRTCYKSEDAMTDTSAARFVKNLLDRKHYAMLEHAVVHLLVDIDLRNTNNPPIRLQRWLAGYYPVAPAARRIIASPISHTQSLLTANVRVWVETLQSEYNDAYFTAIQNALHKYIPEVFPDARETVSECPACFVITDEAVEEVVGGVSWAVFHYTPDDILRRHLHHSVRFVCDRGVSHELVRHRVASFAQESTRYCNYSKDKFGNAVTFIKPCFFDVKDSMYDVWKRQCESAEQWYLAMLANGASPQEARSILPNSLKTEIVVTANEDEWQHIFNLRAKGTTGKPHPQMLELMLPLYEEMHTLTGGRIR